MITQRSKTNPVVVTDSHVRCRLCHRLLAERASRPWRITCSRCGATNLGDVRPGKSNAAIDQPGPAAIAPTKPESPPSPPRRRKRRKSTLNASLVN